MLDWMAWGVGRRQRWVPWDMARGRSRTRGSGVLAVTMNWIWIVAIANAIHLMGFRFVSLFHT